MSIKEITWEIDKKGCWICTSHAYDKDGYPCCKINGKKKRMNRHIYEQNFGQIPKNMVICHKCDNPSCINPKHLFLGTMADNMKDKIKKGRHVTCPGEKHGQSKLTEQEIIDIINSNLNRKELSEKYNTTEKYIGMIQRGEKWKYLFEQNKVKKIDRCLKLTDEKVAEIRNIKGLSQRQIAKIYNISFQHINEIINYKKRIGVQNEKI